MASDSHAPPMPDEEMQTWAVLNEIDDMLREYAKEATLAIALPLINPRLLR